MKILLAVPRPLFPADTGGKIRSLNIFSRLATRAEIHAVSFADPVSDAAGIAQMEATFATYTPVFWREPKKYSLTFYAELLGNQFSSMPYFLAKCNLPRFRRAVEKWLASTRFDMVFCDFLHTAVPLQPLEFRPKVVFEHNVEFLLRKRKWEREEQPLRRLVLGREWKKTHAIESEVCRSFDHVIAVSDDDQRTLQRNFAVQNVSTVPTAVDTDFFRPREEAAIPKRLVFVGSMDWEPNEDGILWFCRDIYPLIRKQMPGVTLNVVGRNPSSKLQRVVSGDSSVQITGWVPDIRPHLAQAEVVVVPLRVGGGTRIKIPEAMAMGKPVVSTPLGAEGLPFRDGNELCIAEEPEQFSRKVLELLDNITLRTSIEQTARDQVVAGYGWIAAVDRLEQTLLRVTSSTLTGMTIQQDQTHSVYASL